MTGSNGSVRSFGPPGRCGRRAPTTASWTAPPARQPAELPLPPRRRPVRAQYGLRRGLRQPQPREKPFNNLDIEHIQTFSDPRDRTLMSEDFERLLQRVEADHKRLVGAPLSRTLLLGPVPAGVH